MTLYDMLDKTWCNQKVWIFETNVYDQNTPLFKGTVHEARKNADKVWDYLIREVDHYECTNGILDIRVRSKHYNENLEEDCGLIGSILHKKRRKWRYSVEINQEKEVSERG